jgi:hypothetical protein
MRTLPGETTIAPRALGVRASLVFRLRLHHVVVVMVKASHLVLMMMVS